MNGFGDKLAKMGYFGHGGMWSKSDANHLVKRKMVKTLCKMRCIKAVGIHHIAVEFLTKEGDCVVVFDCLVGIFIVCMTHGNVPGNWQNA